MSMEFFREEYWSRLPFLTPGDFPDPEVEPASLASLALAGRFFTTAPPGKPRVRYFICINSQLYEVGTTVVPIVQMRKLRHKEVQPFAQRHTANN